MLRGYRCIVIAAFGWLSLATNESSIAPSSVGDNQAASERANDSKAPQSATQTIALPKAPEPEPKDAGCPNGKDRRNSDLCAQWKAADAAFDAARAGERQTVIGWIGLLLGFVTMGAALAAAWYAKRAAVATESTVAIASEAAEGADTALAIAERNADAARDLVILSETNAKTQLRAYISPDSVKAVCFDEPEQPFRVEVVAVNTGQTPALNAHFHVRVALYSSILNFDDLTDLPDHKNIDITGAATVGAQRKIHNVGFLNGDITNSEIIEQVFQHGATVICYGYIIYKDIHDVRRISEFCYFLNSDTRLDNGVFAVAPKKNILT